MLEALGIDFDHVPLMPENDGRVVPEEAGMIIARLETLDGKLVNVITLMPKQFSTGSKGFLGLGQVVVGGKRHQVNFQLVEIGSSKRKRS